jgi:hypothetical protein
VGRARRSRSSGYDSSLSRVEQTVFLLFHCILVLDISDPRTRVLKGAYFQYTGTSA